MLVLDESWNGEDFDISALTDDWDGESDKKEVKNQETPKNQAVKEEKPNTQTLENPPKKRKTFQPPLKKINP